jgi:hypothetical protein
MFNLRLNPDSFDETIAHRRESSPINILIDSFSSPLKSIVLSRVGSSMTTPEIKEEEKTEIFLWELKKY